MSDPKSIALIIPLRLTGATHEGELRLRRLCGRVPRDLFDIIISDFGTEPEHRGPIDALERDGIRVVRHPAPTRLFSIGRSRDYGVRMARSPVVMFNDIDFFGTEADYRAIHAEVVRRDIARNRFDFFCAPVAFLTEAGTRHWLDAPDHEKPLAGARSVDDFEAATDIVQSMAYGSSAIVSNRQHYLSVGGHDPGFSGHGAEDYDLLHRLASLAPKGPRPRAYYQDFGDNRPRHYWGFRPYFALYGLDVAARGIHLVHLWHPRRQERGYFKPKVNFRHLRRIMIAFDKTGAQPLPIAGGSPDENWVVVARSAKDIEPVRQLLVLAGSYTLVKPQRSGDAEALLRLLASIAPDRVIIPPEVGSAHPWLPQAVTTAGLRTLVPDTAMCTITNHQGTTLLHYWEEAAIDDLPLIQSGRIPPPAPADDPIFASFGGMDAIMDEHQAAPVRRAKSTRWVRIKRWFSEL